MSNKIVKEFTFPSRLGFTGSAGKQVVKGYVREPASGTRVKTATPVTVERIERLRRWDTETKTPKGGGYKCGGKVRKKR